MGMIVMGGVGGGRERRDTVMDRERLQQTERMTAEKMDFTADSRS